MNKKNFNRHIVERLFLSWKYFLIFSLIVNFFFLIFFVSPVAGSLIFSPLENSGFALCVLAERRFARVYFHDLSSYHLQKKKKNLFNSRPQSLESFQYPNSFRVHRSFN